MSVAAVELGLEECGRDMPASRPRELADRLAAYAAETH